MCHRPFRIQAAIMDGKLLLERESDIVQHTWSTQRPTSPNLS
jgi:hypothetical protein